MKKSLDVTLFRAVSPISTSVEEPILVANIQVNMDNTVSNLPLNEGYKYIFGFSKGDECWYMKLIYFVTMKYI